MERSQNISSRVSIYRLSLHRRRSLSWGTQRRMSFRSAVSTRRRLGWFLFPSRCFLLVKSMFAVSFVCDCGGASSSCAGVDSLSRAIPEGGRR